MGFSYKKLWKLLIDRNMKKQDLQHAAQLSSKLIAFSRRQIREHVADFLLLLARS